MNRKQSGSPERLWEELAEAVVQMDEERTALLARRVLENAFSPKDAILNGLAAGMLRVGEKFAQKVYFVPEVLVCAETMYAGFDILKEHVPEKEIDTGRTVLIGVVRGDHHDIGKNIVALMLRSAGFSVLDLGKDVRTDHFLNTIRERSPDIVALSTLMSTTLEKMEETVAAIRTEFAAAAPKIMIGGAPVTRAFAEMISADFYGRNVQAAVLGARRLTGMP